MNTLLNFSSADVLYLFVIIITQRNGFAPGELFRKIMHRIGILFGLPARKFTDKLRHTTRPPRPTRQRVVRFIGRNRSPYLPPQSPAAQTGGGRAEMYSFYSVGTGV